MAANAQGPAWSSDWLGLFIAKLISFEPVSYCVPMSVPELQAERALLLTIVYYGTE